MTFALQVFLNIVAVITGIFSLIMFFIGFVDDKDLYIPAFIWFMIMVGALACSYLLSTV